MVVVRHYVEDEAGDDALAVAGLVGLDHQPTRELTTALTGRACSGIVLREPSLVIALPEGGEPANPAAALTRFAKEQATRLAGLADLDTVIELLKADRAVPASRRGDALADGGRMEPPPGASQLPDAVPGLLAALLVGAGRYAQAREALAVVALGQAEAEGRLLRQLKRWADAEGRLELPDTPPEWPPGWLRRWPRPSPPPSFSQAFAENLPRARARREAVQAAREMSRGGTREELRELLEAEHGQTGCRG